jgi:hypothetical protein
VIAQPFFFQKEWDVGGEHFDFRGRFGPVLVPVIVAEIADFFLYAGIDVAAHKGGDAGVHMGFHVRINAFLVKFAVAVVLGQLPITLGNAGHFKIRAQLQCFNSHGEIPLTWNCFCSMEQLNYRYGDNISFHRV